ncbi:hypothetical protein H2204_006744 [Knufia peltigerae]|uniref:Uncharacterized protein n=1 Tax=Knufia peltigerae TaxID=1002370 RepID=A0AA38Y357_9EURO|nr:hypothetical protein H2204_006744 [Knufia peltigerae]
MTNLICTKYTSILHLLEDLVHHDTSTTTDLIICSTREEFLDEVVTQLDHHHHNSSTSVGRQDEEDAPDLVPAMTTPSSSHALLSPTLFLLSASQRCRLAFCPSITTLRGYLSSYPPGHFITPELKVHCNGHHIMIVNLLRQHHGTTEFTLQGLSHTFASAVSAAHRTRRSLRLVELRGDIGSDHHHSDPDQGSGLWQAQVPLLSTSIKIRDDGASWGRRTVSVEKVASRWFRLESG